jgi:hypothetical protein
VGQVDRDRLELGETLQYSLTLKVQGQLDFQPQLEQPNFEGFEARGPQSRQNMMWVNGQVSIEQALVWELTAVKSGTLTLGPYTVHAKTAAAGEIRRQTQPIKVVVTRPKGLHFPGAQPQPQPTLDLSRVQGGADPGLEEALRDIKPDRPFPWLQAGLAAAAGLGALIALLTWWRRRPQGPQAPPPPRDPAQWALEQLELARQALQPGGERAFVLRAAGLLRDYLRHRLRLSWEPTLSGALREARRQVASLDPERALSQRLDLLLYGGVPVEPADADWAYHALRGSIIQAEREWPKPVPVPTVKTAPRSRKASIPDSKKR